MAGDAEDGDAGDGEDEYDEDLYREERGNRVSPEPEATAPAAAGPAVPVLASTSLNPQLEALVAMMKPLMEGMTAPLMAIAKSQGGRKRKRGDDEDEEEEAAGTPVLVHLPEHDLKDDAHTVIDWEARQLRPYNGGDWDLYWSKMPIKSEPVIEDIKIGHMTKAPINPNVIKKLHNRGTETTGKQWLSSNYGVEGKGGRIRAESDRTAGAFILDYNGPTGVWDAVDGIHNYTTALRQVRPDDWTGELMLRTLHDCRMFGHSSFSQKQQKDMIMDFFDQVLRHNAMRGRAKKPPMNRVDMLDLAKQLLFQKGIDGIGSFIALEPYSRNKSTVEDKVTVVPRSGRPEGKEKPYSEMTIEEKVRKCCRAYNTAQGCTRKGCQWKHWCSHVDEVKKLVCWKKSHNLKTHK